MKAEIRGNQLIITAEMQEPAPSKSGKSLVVCSTHGVATSTAEVDGKPLKINVTAWIPKE